MNPEKLRNFIQLIDKALEIAERRKEKLKTDEYLTNLEQKKL